MKTKLSSLFVVLFLIFSFGSKAQFESINLNTYKLTDYRYKSLGTQVNASNSGSYYDGKNSNAGFVYKSSINGTSVNGGCSLDYSFIHHSRDYYGYHSVNFGYASAYNDNSTNSTYRSPFGDSESSSESLSNSSTFRLDIYSTNRFYLDSDFFWGVIINTNQSSADSYSRNESDTYYSRQLASFYESKNRGSLQFGKGRVENVTDARLAIYILDDLQKQGRLSRTPNEEEVFKFADFITKALNDRVIDFRIKRIKEYVAIDSFLMSNGLADKTDGLYFGLIDDNWNYARSQTWNTGSEWYVGVSPFLNYFNRFSKVVQGSVAKTRDELSEYGVSFNAGYRSTWISGLKWMEGYSVEGSFNILRYDTVGSYYGGYSNCKSITGNARYYGSYIPSTRTIITAGAEIELTKYIGEEVFDELVVNPRIFGECSYYFSEKFRLNANASLYYNIDKRYDPNYTGDRFGFSLGATLHYYIF